MEEEGREEERELGEGKIVWREGSERWEKDN